MIASTAAAKNDVPRPQPQYREEHEAGIVVRHLERRFGAFRALEDVSFAVGVGQLVALLGPSGSGKSTILRIIAGLERADSGAVELTGRDVTTLPPQHRGIGFVFQHFALFRHMTVRQNIAFGLQVQKLPRREINGRVEEMLNLIQLNDYSHRYPSQLSGGQRQRVALARALAPRPKVLLLDEPFGALDARVREELRTWLRRLHDEVHVTSLFVTHDQHEAFEVADQVVILNQGRVEQMGSPQELYDRPASPFVADFLGAVNQLTGRTNGDTIVLRNGATLPCAGTATEGPVAIYVRPRDLLVTRRNVGHSCWPGTVRRLVALGPSIRLEVALSDGTAIQVEIDRDQRTHLALTPGEHVFISPREVKVFGAAMERNERS